MATRPSVALITARLGSTRLADKNVRRVGMLQLWERAALFARRQGLTPVVDSDDERILEDAAGWGYQIHPRKTPPESQGGTHWQAINAAAADLGLASFVLLQPTSPFRNPKALEDALKAFDGYLPVFTYSRPGIWDGNIGVYPYPDPLAHVAFARWVRQPEAYSHQIDTPEDLDLARQMLRDDAELGHL